MITPPKLHHGLGHDQGWRFIEEPRAYVLTMIRNLGVQRVRRARVVSMERLAEVDGAREVSSDTPDPFDEASGRQRLRLALSALRDLPPRCREVVELRRLHDLSSREIARRLGLSLSTVEKRLARGMTLMAQAMSRAEAPQAQDSEAAQAQAAPGRRRPQARQKKFGL